jgi:hypothetical protein
MQLFMTSVGDNNKSFAYFQALRRHVEMLVAHYGLLYTGVQDYDQEAHDLSALSKACPMEIY